MYIKQYANRKPINEELVFGEVVCQSDTRALYTRTLNSEILRVGNSYHTLLEFLNLDSLGNEDYLYWKQLDASTYVLVADILPSISIINFEEVELEEPLENSYLGIKDSNTSKLTNKVKGTLELGKLGDIQDNIQVGSRDREALTWETVINQYIPNKDYFKSNVEVTYYTGYWTLRPNATLLAKLEDISHYPNDITTNYTIRASAPFERQLGYGRFFEEPFSIDIDPSPELIVDLDSDNYAIYNRAYVTQAIVCEEVDEVSIFIDITEKEVYTIFSNESVLNINLVFEDIEVSSDFKCKHIVLCIKEHTGLLSFPKDVYYENGIQPQLLGKNHIFIVFIYNEGSNIRKTVLYRGINLDRPQNIQNIDYD